jgi:hypothetical protein
VPWLEDEGVQPKPQDQEHSDERDAHQPVARPHDRRHERAQAALSIATLSLWTIDLLFLGVSPDVDHEGARASIPQRAITRGAIHASNKPCV